MFIVFFRQGHRNFSEGTEDGGSGGKGGQGVW